MEAMEATSVEESSREEKEEKLLSIIPKQRGKITKSFDRITFNSDFDSGNLDRVEQCSSESGADTLEYKLWTAPDCAGTEFQNANRTWFHFSVTTCAGLPARIIRLHVMNLNKQSRLYQQGMVPMMKIVPGRGGWERMRERPEWENIESGMKLSFQYNIPEGRKLTVYFAFCYPYSYAECQRHINKLEQHLHVHDPERPPMGQRDKEEVYYHRELLCRSLDGLRIDLMTISSHEGITTQQETRLEGLFPNTDEERPRKFSDKKVVMISCRVHPGETPSSFVFNGFLNFLLRPDDPRAMILRKHFVFKMIPMLNPDGVARGHYRTDSRGVNLNRFYTNPSPAVHPSIYAARRLIIHHHSQTTDATNESSAMAKLEKESAAVCEGSSVRSHRLGHQYHSNSTDKSASTDDGWPADPMAATSKSGVALYVDLHAHASKRGCFMYGNYHKEEKAQAESMLFPYLVSLNSMHFDFDHCLFSERNMRAPDKKDVTTTKEGSGRVALYKATGLMYSYTLECNYNSGRKTNQLSPATMDGRLATPPQTASLFPHKFSISDYEEVGRGVAIALLDMHQINPWSRLPSSNLSSLSNVRHFLLQRTSITRSRKDCSKISAMKRFPVMRRPSSISGEGGDSDKEDSCTQLTDIAPVKPPLSLPTAHLSGLQDNQIHQIKPLHSSSDESQHYATVTPVPAGKHWLSLTHSMRHFTSDSILLRHHNRHNFSQSSLPIAISSSNPRSSHPDLYVRNSTSLPNSTPLTRLRQLLATQASGAHPSSSFTHMSVSGKRCPARPVLTKNVSLPQVGTPIKKKEKSSESKSTDQGCAYWVDLEPHSEGIRRTASSSAHLKGRGLRTHKRTKKKSTHSSVNDHLPSQHVSKPLTVTSAKPTSRIHLATVTACDLLSNRTASSKNKSHRSSKVPASSRSTKQPHH